MLGIEVVHTLLWQLRFDFGLKVLVNRIPVDSPSHFVQNCGNWSFAWRFQGILEIARQSLEGHEALRLPLSFYNTFACDPRLSFRFLLLLPNLMGAVFTTANLMDAILLMLPNLMGAILVCHFVFYYCSQI